MGALLCAPAAQSDTASSPPRRPPDTTLRPFDAAKARDLSREKRRQYDLRFFNEMSLRQERPFEPRYQLFREMAEDGFEVADLALRLYSIRTADEMLRDPAAMKRLKALAAQGDLSAKCFYGTYAWRGDRATFDRMELLPYIIDAADGGHPYCTGALASFLRGDGALPPHYEDWIRIQKNPARRVSQALELEERAARAGDLRSQSSLALRYRLGKDVSLDYGRARCWAAIAVQTSGSAPLVVNDAISLENGIRWVVNMEKYDSSQISKYREDSWCTETIAQ
jgi:TPR repeat protein